MQRKWKRKSSVQFSLNIPYLCTFRSLLLNILNLELLQHNTSTGPFQKLGRLYESCLRQSINSSYVRLKMQEIGTYMPMTVTGPATIGITISKSFN